MALVTSQEMELNMSRDNGGIKAKVTTNAGQGAVERGGGQSGITVDMTTRKGTNPAIPANPVMADMASHHGPRGSSGTDKNMGGVGDYGQDANQHQKGYFGGNH